MAIENHYLCVGGSLDGEFRNIERAPKQGDRVRLQGPPKYVLPTSIGRIPVEVVAKEDLNEVDYEFHVWHGDGKDFFMLSPSGWDYEKVMSHLINNYAALAEKSRRHNRVHGI